MEPATTTAITGAFGLAWPWWLTGNWLSLIVLTAAVVLILIFERKKFKREAPLLYLRRTKRGLAMIDRGAKKHKRFFKAFGSLGVILSLGALGVWYLLVDAKARIARKIYLASAYAAITGLLILALQPQFFGLVSFFSPDVGFAVIAAVLIMSATFLFGMVGLGLGALTLAAASIFLGAVSTPQVQLILPLPEVPAGLPIIGMPIFDWAIAIAVILIVHELAHAYVARTEKIRVKSLGYGFLAIIPAGFAEPDEAQMRRLKKKEIARRVKIYAAGSFSNVITAIVLGFLLAALFLFSWTPLAMDNFERGAVYYELTPGFPAELSGMPQIGVITSANGIALSNRSDFIDIASALSPGDELSLVVNGQSYSLMTVADPHNATRAIIGIRSVWDIRPELVSQIGPAAPVFTQFLLKEDVRRTAFGFGIETYFYALRTLNWVAVLNLAVAIINLLPLRPFDGGYLFADVVGRVFKKRQSFAKKVVRFFMIATIALIIINLVGPYLRAI